MNHRYCTSGSLNDLLQTDQSQVAYTNSRISIAKPEDPQYLSITPQQRRHRHYVVTHLIRLAYQEDTLHTRHDCSQREAVPKGSAARPRLRIR
jgi:hypothetical protein